MINPANPNIQRMKPYSPPLENRREYDGLLLDFNEATVPISQKVMEALQNMVNENRFQVYPEYADFNNKLADYTGTKPEQIIATNGSDKAIELIFRTFTQKDAPVIIPSPSFAMFYQYAKMVSNQISMPTYKADLSFPTDEVIESITPDTKLVTICNPNNPTGTLAQLDDIEAITKKALENDALVFVDEAYYEFSKVTAIPLIDKYPNLIITRTFSKAFGLTALRVGYAIAQARLIEEMQKVRGPYDVNMAGLIAARAALKDRQSMRKYVDEVINEAKPMVETFFKENGVEFYPSSANFILFKPNNPQCFEALKEKGILTRPRKSANIDGTIRVTIGTVEQMKKFIETYKDLFINQK